MTPSDPDPARRVLWGTAAFLAFVGLLAWGLTPPSRAPFDEAVAKLRSAGFATTLEEHLGTPPPDDENAAVELVAAWRDLVAGHGEPETWGVTGPWDPSAIHPWPETASAEQMEALAQVLDRIAPQIDRIEAATTRPRLWFREVRDSLGFMTQTGVQHLQRIQRILGAEAAASRDPRRRLAAAAAMLRIGAMDDPRNVIDGMVRAAIAAAGSSALRPLVERREVSAEEARAVCDGPLRTRLTDRLPQVVRGEICWVADACDAYLDGRTPRGTPAMGGPFTRARLATIVRDLFDGSESVETPAEVADLLDRMSRASALPTSSAAELHREVTGLSGGAPGGSLSGTWMPRFVERMAKTDAAHSLARVALAAAEFREREGRWPESLDALAPMFPDGVPVDPCDGKPFEFVVAEGKVRLIARVRLAGAAGAASKDGLVWEFEAR